jgi:Taurine catabolism dioxygenase TauD, TfdA family
LHPILRNYSKEIHHGRGFFVLRGLVVDKYTTEENVIIYAGLSSHIGAVRGKQDSNIIKQGDAGVLAHIKDLSTTSTSDKIGAPAYTTDKQVFHTDAGDIVSLFALNTAASGGESKLSSSWRVYNSLAKERPDIIRTLPLSFKNPQSPYTVRPLLYHQAATSSAPERVIIQYARRTFTGFQALPRSADIPPITEAQAEALDAIHFQAEKYCIGLNFQKGDIQYINNLSLFHARDGFTDAPGKE